MKPRLYQDEAARKAWAMASGRPALVALPTGTGKTFTQVLVAQLARAANPSKPILWLAHRSELLDQAAATFRRVEWQPFIEQAGRRAKPFQVREAAIRMPVVVCASVPTMQGKRLAKWRPDDFAAVLVDEAHHGVASSWAKTLRHWECPIIGFTATPQRQGLDSYFEIAYSMSLVQAISEGWLVPIKGKFSRPEGWDMSGFTKPRGAQDVNIKELCKMVNENIGGVVSEMVDWMQGRQTLSFWPSVVAAEGCARMLDASDISACWVSGATEDEERESAVTAFREGRIQAISNCDVFTEGFDAPSTRVLALARPTRSEVLYLQMLGRALRPLPGVIDGIESAEERRAAIADSAKPHAVVLDYHGSGAKFDLMSLTVALGSGRPPEVVERAKERLGDGGPQDVSAALDKAERDIEQERMEREERERRAAERARLRAEEMARQAAEYKARMAQGQRYASADAPWLDASTVTRLQNRAQGKGERATPKQRGYLYKLLKRARVDQRLASEIWKRSETWSKREASKEIEYTKRRYRIA